MPRRLLLVLALLGLAGAGFGVWDRFLRQPAADSWQGYAEADFVKVGPTLQGALTAVHVARGDRVRVGTPLFDQDDAFETAARDQAADQLGQATMQLANLKAPGRSTEIAQAEANLQDAQATRQRIEADLRRTSTLAQGGNASLQSLDQGRADLASSIAKVSAMTAALQQMRTSSGRFDEIKAQAAAVEAARHALEMAEWRLAQRRVTSPAAGTVADVLARSGETIAAGAPVVSILPPANIFVRFFVPEPSLARVHIGDPVQLVCDGCPTNFTARIDFVAPQAEYTPPLIYSDQSRAKLVYMAQARPRPEQAALLNPGEPVAVRPIVDRGARP